MGLESIKCFECQEYGHLAKDCPGLLYAVDLKDTKPLWCGQCDDQTRLVYFIRDGIETARKCKNCNPKPGLPVTYSRCATCRHAVYAWDKRTPCDQHKPVGKHMQCKREECECHKAASGRT
jgi:hypothetical protein